MDAVLFRKLLIAMAAIVAMPVAALATAPALGCKGAHQVGRWEALPVPSFREVPGVPASDAITSYGVDPVNPQSMAATNGVRVLVSGSAGCAWTESFALSAGSTASQTFVGAAAHITSAAVTRGHTIVAIQEGSDNAARPHVLLQDGGGWTTVDEGLPLSGTPGVIRSALDGRVIYLTVTPPPASAADGVVNLLPPTGLGSMRTAFLYASTDGGRHWVVRTTAGGMPSGSGFTTLDIDPGDSDRLYGISGGQLLISNDGGSSFTSAGGGFTAVTAMRPSQLAAFTSDGAGRVSSDAGSTFQIFTAPLGITSAAFRKGDGALIVESSGVLRRISTRGGSESVPAASPVRPGSLIGDQGDPSSFHAVADHALLRYVDPPEGVGSVPLAPLFVRPEVSAVLPGRIAPSMTSLVLRQGQTRDADLSVQLAAQPVKLDLAFLIDTSDSMQPVMQDLKRSIGQIIDRLRAPGVDVQVALATLSGGTRRDDPATQARPDIPVDPAHPGQTRSGLYKLVRKMGPADEGFLAAVAGLHTEPQSGSNAAEGQLAALDQLATGSGIQDPRAPAAAPLYLVPPGQSAGWRHGPEVQHVAVLATDERFDDPIGSPETPQGGLDFDGVIQHLRALRIASVGLTGGEREAYADLARMARGTAAVALRDGLSCGDSVLHRDAPLVCSGAGGTVGTALSNLAGASLAPSSFVVRDKPASAVAPWPLSPAVLTQYDVTHPAVLPVRVHITCNASIPAHTTHQVSVYQRAFRVATASLALTCLPAVPPLPPPAPPADLPPPLDARPPLPVGVLPLPAPAGQPAVSNQLQLNPNPMAAGALEEQEQVQLALAGQAVEDEQHGEVELAMVSRPRKAASPGLTVALALAMTCSVGLAEVRRRRNRSQLCTVRC
jgi:hypothetical protein